MTEKHEICCELSLCGKYMYKLSQEWGKEEKKCVFIMLNPATTDEKELKKNLTVKNCRDIAKDKGCGGMILLDLFSYVAENGGSLKEAKKNSYELDIIGGRKHRKHIKSTLKKWNILIVIAWRDDRSKEFKGIVGFDEQVEYMEKMIRKYASSAEIMQLEKPMMKKMSHPCKLSKLEEIKNRIKKNKEKYNYKDYYELAPYTFKFEQDGFLCKLLCNLYAPLKRIACKQGNSL